MLIKNYFQKLKENKTAVIFLAIMLVAIFLRTYDYSDLLRFGKDQARDAGIIQAIIAEKEPLPLLGPKAGGTDFKMGPIFYYFQYASAKIFGFSPVTVAFPDLLFSLLTLPLLFFFLKKYFNARVSLALTALYAVSFFAVQNSRFAWNPNSLPLFSLLFLYAFLELVSPVQKRKILWAVICGIAIGVGVQLHTLYIMVALPVFILFSLYLMKKKLLALKNFALVICFALILNVPQIVFEAKTNGQNARAFFTGITQKSEERPEAHLSFPLNFFTAALWHGQAGNMFLSGSGSDTDSSFLSLADELSDNKKGIEGIVEHAPDIIILLLETILFFGGCAVLIYFWRKETDGQKRIFLQLNFFYIAASFLVLIPLSHVLMLRYFLILQFVPFLLLGLVFKFLEEKYGKKTLIGFFVIVIFFGWLNVSKIYREFRDFSLGKGDVGIAIWSEQKILGDFILAHSSPDQKLWFVFEPLSAHKFIRPLAYFRDDISFSPLANDSAPLEEENVAYFTLILDKDKEEKAFKKRFQKSGQYEIENSMSHGRFKIFKLKLK